jgi:exosome complex component RRP4
MDVDDSSTNSATRKISNVQLALPGEVVTDDPTAMRGHGTYLLDGKIVASVAGIVERIGKLLSVRPLKSRCVRIGRWK